MDLTIKHRTIKDIASIFCVDYKDQDSTTEQVKIKPLLSEKTNFTFHKSIHLPLPLGLFLYLQIQNTLFTHKSAIQFPHRAACVESGEIVFLRNTWIWTNMFDSKVKN